jgi:hypothetical protein
MDARSKVVPPDDWRRRNQERFLRAATLTRGPWRQHSPEWDHDHCEFCIAKFSVREGDLKSGYSTVEDQRWICETCFDDFHEEFGFVVRPATA